jgi:Fic family protein
MESDGKLEVSMDSSTRIEDAKLTDREVEHLLSNLDIKSFASRDEQEVAGYAAAMETVFTSWEAIDLTENHLRQLHRDLLKYSTKDERHRGEYKTLPNDVAAFDADGKSLDVVSRDPSIPRWQWATLESSHDATAFAERLCVRPL